MNISIFGLGYVGCVGAACLAKLGHHVIGVDVNENKVRLINEGKPTIIEEGIAELCAEAHAAGRMRATMDASEAVKSSDISFIVVGTPSSKEGHLNLNYIFAVAGRIGQALKEKQGFHIIAIRSTVLPGTNEKVGEIIERESGKKRNIDFAVVSNPEFLREGTSVKDYFNPPLTLIGTDNPLAEARMRELYKDLPAELICTDIKVAEIMKYVNNTVTPLALLMAGNTIHEIGLKKLRLDRVQLSVMAFRFLIAPGLCLALCAMLGVTGLARSVLVVQTAMPVLTQAVVASTEYGGDERMAAQGVAITTLACFVVIPALMLLLCKAQKTLQSGIKLDII